jgi:hypothetical protein
MKKYNFFKFYPRFEDSTAAMMNIQYFPDIWREGMPSYSMADRS